MATQPNGLSRDGTVLAQVLKQLGDIQEALTHVAQKEDLKGFVTQAEYAAGQASVVGRLEDHAQRLTRTETQNEQLREKFHQAEVSEARQFAQVQVTGTQQVSQAQLNNAQQILGVQRQAAGWQLNITNLLLSGLGAAVIYLLIYALQHH